MYRYGWYWFFYNNTKKDKKCNGLEIASSWAGEITCVGRFQVNFQNKEVRVIERETLPANLMKLN